ncbi:MAG: penicillin-binding protein 2 [Desulfobacterales bacterium]|nr:penicillin-binding protein 2 [Desulfobacterales bacterium]
MSKKPINKEKRKLNGRIVIVGIFFSLIYSAIALKAIYLQVFQAEWLANKALQEYEKDLVVKGKRGSIYDCKFKELAISIKATSIAVFTKQIVESKSTASDLSKILNIDKNAISKQLESNSSFVWIKRQASPKEVEEVKKLKIKGISFISEASRYYPKKTIAGQVIGFSGIDDKGLEGIEYYYNKYLEGKPCRSKILKDALGRGFNECECEEIDSNGKNIVLTIDSNIQYITDKALEEAVTKHSANYGLAIVMSPKNGEILAISNYPFVNPNSFGEYEKGIRRNKVITDAFEPGSTMKIFLAAAALESGICNEGSVFFCENGLYKVGRNVIHDTHSYGWLSLFDIIKFSSNIGSTKITELIGKKQLYDTLTAFGFGQKTNINLGGESCGSLSSYKQWKEIDAGNISFGQGISVSPLQLVTATCAIANGGILYKPYIVKEIIDNDGNCIKKFTHQQKRRVISKKTSSIIKNIMSGVVTDGTGTNASVEGYNVCGKTGTAQKIDFETGRYARGKYFSSFLGFAPAENPEIVVFVALDEPKKYYYGGTVAAPAFKMIVRETLNYLHVPPLIENKELIMTIAKQLNN